MEMCIGDDNLRQQIERMNKLSEIKRKIRAYQYLEILRNEVLADSLFRTEEKVERQQEQPVTNASRRTIIFAKIEAEILKKILTSNRNAVLVVKWMTIIKEHHQKMDSVHTELLIIKMEVFSGEDNLRQQIERIDKLSEIKRKIRAYQYLEILRNEVLADSLFRTEEKVERQQEQPVTNASRRTIIFAKIEAEILKKILTSNRNAVLVVKWMTIIKEHHQKMDSDHTELLKKVKEREDNTIADSLKKLENLNQNKWNATLDAWDKVKRNQIVFSILVDQVRKIRTRRCPQMAGKMMKKLQDRHLVLEKLQEELMKKVNERENIRQAKKTIEEELLMEINRKEEMTTRRKMLHMELMLEDAPRVVNEREDGPSVSLSYEDQPQPQSQTKKEAKAKLTLKSRIKRIFGFR